MSRNYKNVYTILEKVKKGEIKTYYDNSEDGKGSLFSKVNFYKKPDLIKPHLHWLDENRIDAIMSAYLNKDDSIKKSFNNFAKSKEYNGIADLKKPDYPAFCKKVRENYKKFPKHMIKDIFKMYYHKMEKLDFEERTDKNYVKYKFLEKANNPVAKIMTEQSNLKSAIFSRNILTHYLTKMTMMDYVDPDASNKIQNNMNGNSSDDNPNDNPGNNPGSNDDVKNALDKLMDDKSFNNSIDDSIKEATDLCKNIDRSLDDEVQQKMFEDASKPGSDSSAGQLSPQYIKNIAEKLARITFSMGSLKEKIKKLLDKSVSYFSAKEQVIYEDLFNSNNIAGLDDYELLHPKLRKIFAEDVYVKETKSIGKIDIYIDISGSMSNGCGVRDDKGNEISRIDFCKSFAVKLLQMDMLNKIYVFNNTTKEYKTDIINISMLDTSGGTCIDNAVRKIEREGRNALVITDAEDHCSIYSEKAFFIGLEGANFTGFHESVMKQYSNKGQVVIFNGKSIKKVNSEGLTVN